VKQSIARVALVVHDYDDAIAFFTKALKFDLVEDTYVPEQEKRWVVLAPKGGSTSLLLARASNDEQRAAVGNQTDRTPAFEPPAMWENEHITRHSRQTRRAVFGLAIYAA